MSRRSKVLQRFGAPLVAALTVFAGVPALSMTAANAAAGDTIVMTPNADSASAGTCNPFTVTVRNSAGQPTTSTVDVVITQRNNGAATSADTFDVTFCTTTTGSTPLQTPTNQSSTGTPTGAAPTGNLDTDTRRGEFRPGADGTFTFGVVGTEAGTADILAYLDNNNDNTVDTGENTDTSVKTFTAGGAQGVQTVDATPETDNNFIGETHTITVRLANSTGNTVAGVPVRADITAGPNAAITPTCGTTNNDGFATCTYSGTATGTDTIVVYVNQANADNNTGTADTTGPDAGEPQDVVQKTWSPAPTGLTVDLTCGDATTARTTAEDCINVLSDTTEVFTATVRNASGALVPNVIINFTVAGTAADANDSETVSPTSATTNASGVATTTLTDTRPTEDEVIVVTATIRGQAAGAGTADSATKTWNTATTGERNIVLTPPTATTAPGTFRTFTALVTNVNGEPVSGALVRFTETGAGAFRTGTSQVDVRTDLNGIATVDVTSAPGETGTQTITAAIFGPACSSPAGTPAGSTAGNCTDTSTNTFANAPTASPAPGCRIAALRINTRFINATGLASVTVTGVAPNSVVEIQGYSQDHYLTRNFANDTTPVDRVVTSDANGSATISNFRLSSNSRFRARQRGCAFGNSDVVNVRTLLTLAVTQVGSRSYIISGKSTPARPGGLIVSLYRIVGAPCAAGVRPADCPGEVLLRQTRADQTTGNYSFATSFPANTAGTRLNLVLKTGQDAQNAPGRSNVRSLLVTNR